MRKRLWNKIKYLSRANVLVRIPVIAFVAVYLFIRDLIKWEAIYYGRSGIRQKVAVACSFCLCFAMIFGHVGSLAADESLEVISEDQLAESEEDLTGQLEDEVIEDEVAGDIEAEEEMILEAELVDPVGTPFEVLADDEADLDEMSVEVKKSLK